MSGSDQVYYFAYYDAQGDVYYGYVYDDGTYGYYLGYSRSVWDDVGTLGGYYVYAAYDLGYDSPYTGYVGVTDYWDGGSGQWAYALGYGWGGLGSEIGWAYTAGWASYDWFAYGLYEADLVTDTVYYFVHYDAQGDVYYGYVYDDGSYGYAVGDTLGVGDNVYVVYAGYALGYDSPYTGYVGVTDYYDAGTAQWTSALGYGWGGLGSEIGWAYTAGWASYDWFAYGLYEADLGDSVYYFVFRDGQGDVYYGYVYDDGTYGYQVGAVYAVGDGAYEIYAADALGYDAWFTGYTVPTDYYDADSGRWAYAWGYGWDGLGSEWGYAITEDWSYDWFGYAVYEADLPAGTASGLTGFTFLFVDDSGDWYEGVVFDDGRYGYAVGQTIDAVGGVYLIENSFAAEGYAAVVAAGAVLVGSYYDAASGALAVTDSFLTGTAVGADGLGQEYGLVYTAAGWDDFGYGGALDVDGAPAGGSYFAAAFTHYAGDGDTYSGVAYSAAAMAEATWQGAYYVGDVDTVWSPVDLDGLVVVTAYRDADGGWGAPVNSTLGAGAGWGGLGSEYDYLWNGAAWDGFGPDDGADL